jgi:hypothetical protein
MGKTLTLAILPLLAACASRAAVEPAVAPSLPPASYPQVQIVDPGKTVLGLQSEASRTAPCVIDVQEALKSTPEAKEWLAKGYERDRAEYHMLLYRANERMRSAIKRVALRHGYDLVLERGAVVLRPGLTDVAIADITPEVVFEVARP